MVSALDSVSSGLSSSPGLGHCVMFLGKILTLTVPFSTQEYKWVPATKCWGITCDGLPSHPGGVAILLVGFMLMKPA